MEPSQETLSGGFIAAIYLSGGLLNLLKSLLARRGFAFSVSLCWFSFPVATECLRFPPLLFSLAFKELAAPLNVRIERRAL